MTPLLYWVYVKIKTLLLQKSIFLFYFFLVDFKMWPQDKIIPLNELGESTSNNNLHVDFGPLTDLRWNTG